MAAAPRTRAKEIIDPVQVIAMFEMGFTQNTGKETPLSHQDRMFMQKVREGINQRLNGHYEIPPSVEERHRETSKQQQPSPELSEQITHQNGARQEVYKERLCCLHTGNHVQRVRGTDPPERRPRPHGQIWYLPHHGVYHPQKPGKY